MLLNNIIRQITPLDYTAMQECRQRLDNLTKPLGSLHHFENLACQIAGITGLARSFVLQKGLVIMAADHGIYSEGQAATTDSTVQFVKSLCSGILPVSFFAAHAGADITLVDVGVAQDLPALNRVLPTKVAFGTKNILQQPAMTREQLLLAIGQGIKFAQEQTAAGVQVLGLGAAGAGEAVPCMAVISCYSKDMRDNLSSEASRYLRNISAGNILLSLVNKLVYEASEPLEVLCRLGGLETAGLVGVILGAAAGKAAIVLDGIATITAALIAMKIAPNCREYLIGSHASAEPAAKTALELCKLPAYLQLDMSCGDGTGALLGMRLIDASLHVLNDMKTFEEASVAVADAGSQ